MRTLRAGLAISAAASLIATGLLALPAQAADPTELPANANATDSSGVQVLVCPDRVYIHAPAPAATDPQALEFEGIYQRFEWVIDAAPSKFIDLVTPEYALGTTFLPFRVVPRGDLDQTLLAAGKIRATAYGTATPTVVDFPVTNLTEPSWAGAGTASNPYLITNFDELNYVRCNLSAHYRLANDIDLTGKTWMPIGGFDDAYRFTGGFDGAGHKISNLKVIETAELGSFFGAIGNAIIRNLTFENATVTSIYRAAVVFGLAGGGNQATGSLIEDVAVVGNSKVTSRQFAGLIAGEIAAHATMLTNVTARGTVLMSHFISRQASSASDHSAAERPNFEANGIAGVVGFTRGNGGLLRNVDVDVAINAPTVNRTVAINPDRQDSLLWSGVGLVTGYSREEYPLSRATVRGSISLNSYGDVQYVGLAHGSRIETADKNLDAAGSIAINIAPATGQSNVQVSQVGGLVGRVREYSAEKVFGQVDIAVSAAAATSMSQMHRVGGAFGEFGEVNLAGVGVDSDLTFDLTGHASPPTIREVGVLGGALVNSGVAIDLGVTGKISTRGVGPTELESQGGLVGLIGSSGRLVGNRIFVSPAIDYQGVAIEDLTFYRPLISGSDAPALSVNLVQTFVNEGLSGVSLTSSDPGYAGSTAATTDQLKSRNFLQAAGFDFSQVWRERPGNYPTIRLLTASAIGGGGGAVTAGPLNVSTVGQTTFTRAGGLLTLAGSGLSATRFEIAGQPAFLSASSDSSAVLMIPAGLAAGSYDLVAILSTGVRITLQSMFTIEGDGASGQNASLGAWTTRVAGATSAKIYARGVVGAGKVSFVLNGREIAWVRAIDAADPKLRVPQSGPMAGVGYLVRTVTLMPGKNVIEIYVDGERVRRVAYTR